MPIEHEYETSITVMGTEIPVTVTYIITSHGSSDTWEEPGDPPEIEIINITDSFGNNMTEWCNKHHDYEDNEYKPWILTINNPTDNWQDRIRIEMFGIGVFNITTNKYYRKANNKKFEINAMSFTNVIEREIIREDINNAISSEQNMDQYYD